MKYCKDCKYCIKGQNLPPYELPSYLCAYPEYTRIDVRDPVTGGGKLYPICTKVRLDKSRCGAEARLYIRKWWKIWIS